MTELRRPGGGLSNRPLHFIWICDCSGSMNDGGKIQELNFAIRESIPSMREVADDNPTAEVLVRAITFADTINWVVKDATPVNDFEWRDLFADGSTAMGEALKAVAQELKMPPMPSRALPPVLALISDGQPTDNFAEGLGVLMAEPWASKAVRISIGIGSDVDIEPLKAFIAGSIDHLDNKELRQPLIAKNAPQLVKYIKWASTAVLKAASSPVPVKAKGAAISPGIVAVPEPVQDDELDDDSVW